jgi:hypothetical protein
MRHRTVQEALRRLIDRCNINAIVATLEVGSIDATMRHRLRHLTFDRSIRCDIALCKRCVVKVGSINARSMRHRTVQVLRRGCNMRHALKIDATALCKRCVVEVGSINARSMRHRTASVASLKLDRSMQDQCDIALCKRCVVKVGSIVARSMRHRCDT